MLSINTNLSSIITQNSMKQSTNALNQAIERMSTGFKINHAKDNAANYSISTNMTTKIGSYQIAEENAAMGLDLVTTASSTLDLVSEHVQRIRDLCEQASNGTYGEESLKAIQSEVDARQQEIDRILSQAEYNGIKMLEGESTNSPYAQTDVPFLKPITRLTEEEAMAQGYTLVRNADELITALNNNESVCLMNDIDMTGKDYTYYGGGVAVFIESYSGGTIEGNGYAIKNISSTTVSALCPTFFANVRNGTIKNIEFKYSDLACTTFYSISSSFQGDSVIDNVSITGSVTTGNTFYGFGYGSGNLLIRDSYINVTSIGSPRLTYAYLDNLTNVTVENSYFNKDIINDTASPGGVTKAELNAILAAAQPAGGGDKTISLQIGTMGDSNSQISFVSSVALESLAINCLDSNSARNSLTTLDDYLKKINAKQVEYGAVQNRLESALEEISVQYDNLVSSRSTLRDADIAEESSKYIQAQILQQASATLMATANQSPSIALQLI